MAVPVTACREGYLSHQSKAEKPLLGRGEGERESKFTKRARDGFETEEGRLDAFAPEPTPSPGLSPLPPHLGCTAQVVIVYLLDGLEIDHPLQFRLMLVCKGNEGQAERLSHFRSC